MSCNVLPTPIPQSQFHFSPESVALQERHAKVPGPISRQNMRYVAGRFVVTRGEVYV